MGVVVDQDVVKHWQNNEFGVVVGLGDNTIVASFPTPLSESDS